MGFRYQCDCGRVLDLHPGDHCPSCGRLLRADQRVSGDTPTRPTDAAMREAWEAIQRLAFSRHARTEAAKLSGDAYCEAWDSAIDAYNTALDRIYALADSLASSLAAGQGVGGGETLSAEDKAAIASWWCWALPMDDVNDDDGVWLWCSPCNWGNAFERAADDRSWFQVQDDYRASLPRCQKGREHAPE